MKQQQSGHPRRSMLVTWFAIPAACVSVCVCVCVCVSWNLPTNVNVSGSPLDAVYYECPRMAGVHCLGHMGNNCIFYVSRLPECNLKFIDIHKAQDKPSTLHANLLSSWLAICCKYVAALLGRTGNNMCTVYTVQPTFGGFPPGWHDGACFRFMAFLYHLHFTYNFWSVVICSIVISVGAHSRMCTVYWRSRWGRVVYIYVYYGN